MKKFKGLIVIPDNVLIGPRKKLIEIVEAAIVALGNDLRDEILRINKEARAEQRKALEFQVKI